MYLIGSIDLESLLSIEDNLEGLREARRHRPSEIFLGFPDHYPRQKREGGRNVCGISIPPLICPQ